MARLHACDSVSYSCKLVFRAAPFEPAASLQVCSRLLPTQYVACFLHTQRIARVTRVSCHRPPCARLHFADALQLEASVEAAKAKLTRTSCSQLLFPFPPVPEHPRSSKPTALPMAPPPPLTDGVRNCQVVRPTCLICYLDLTHAASLAYIGA